MRILILLGLVLLATCKKEIKQAENTEVALMLAQSDVQNWGLKNGLHINFENGQMICFFEDYVNTLVDATTYQQKVIAPIAEKVAGALLVGGSAIRVSIKGMFYINAYIYSKALGEWVTLSFKYYLN